MKTTSRPAPVPAATALAEVLLRPQAERVDQSVVPPSHLGALAAAGLLGATAPVALGGAGAGAPAGRQVAEILAGACGATWFVWTQHALPLSAALQAGHPCAADLASGRLLAGVAVAHLRRPGPAAVTATRVGEGWRFDGRVGWLTGWGLSQVFLLYGLTVQGQVVSALVPARPQAGLRASAPLRLTAMAATRTVSLELTGLMVTASEVVQVVDGAQWRTADEHKTANASPHTFGLQREIVRRLAVVAERRGDAGAAGLADQLAAEGAALRTSCYTLIDDVPAGAQVALRLQGRARSLELVVRSATALVAATGGGALELTAAPQRLAREAMFHLVQAQTGAVRAATLALLARGGPVGG